MLPTWIFIFDQEKKTEEMHDLNARYDDKVNVFFLFVYFIKRRDYSPRSSPPH